MPKRLSNAELYYIESNPQGKTAKELSKELGFHENIIKKYMKSKPKKVEQKVETPKPKSIPFDENAAVRMGRKISDKTGEVVGVVMTPGASETGDLARDRRGPVNLRDSLKNAIHKPKGGGHHAKNTDYEKIALDLAKEVEQLKKQLAENE